MEPGRLIRDARLAAGLTQADLAGSLGVTQPSVAALERIGSNPTTRTLERALNACGRSIATTARPTPDVDEEQIRARLALTPAQRLATHQRSQHNLGDLLRKVRRASPSA